MRARACNAGFMFTVAAANRMSSDGSEKKLSLFLNDRMQLHITS